MDTVTATQTSQIQLNWLLRPWSKKHWPITKLCNSLSKVCCCFFTRTHGSYVQRVSHCRSQGQAEISHSRTEALLYKICFLSFASVFTLQCPSMTTNHLITTLGKRKETLNTKRESGDALFKKPRTIQGKDLLCPPALCVLAWLLWLVKLMEWLKLG